MQAYTQIKSEERDLASSPILAFSLSPVGPARRSDRQGTTLYKMLAN